MVYRKKECGKTRQKVKYLNLQYGLLTYDPSKNVDQIFFSDICALSVISYATTNLLSFLAGNPYNYMHLNLLPPDYCGGLLCAVAWSTFFGGAIGNIPTFFTLPMTVIIVSDLLSDITLLLCHQFTIECFETETLWPKRVNRNVILGSLKHWAGDVHIPYSREY